MIEAIANLVDNAIKFTPRRRQGETWDWCREDDMTIVRVTDTGPGISDAGARSRAAALYRSDKMRNTPGVGLGLNLVAAIVKLHGFRLIIGPAPGGRIEILRLTGRASKAAACRSRTPTLEAVNQM